MFLSDLQDIACQPFRDGHSYSGEHFQLQKNGLFRMRLESPLYHDDDAMVFLNAVTTRGRVVGEHEFHIMCGNPYPSSIIEPERRTVINAARKWAQAFESPLPSETRGNDVHLSLLQAHAWFNQRWIGLATAAWRGYQQVGRGVIMAGSPVGFVPNTEKQKILYVPDNQNPACNEYDPKKDVVVMFIPLRENGTAENPEGVQCMTKSSLPFPEHAAHFAENDRDGFVFCDRCGIIDT